MKLSRELRADVSIVDDLPPTGPAIFGTSRLASVCEVIKDLVGSERGQTIKLSERLST